jgi:hypothetical protein
MAGSRITAACVKPGPISLSNSSHFPPMPYSNEVKPVALPPGRARLSTYPAPTGSGTIANTMGTLRVASSNGPAAALPLATMTSGASATSSPACLRMSSGFAPLERSSMRRLRPTSQALQQRGDPSLADHVIGAKRHQHAHAPHRLALLRARRERPGRCAPEKREELTAPAIGHRISPCHKMRRLIMPPADEHCRRRVAAPLA